MDIDRRLDMDVGGGLDMDVDERQGVESDADEEF